jgi:hypothetical protein
MTISRNLSFLAEGASSSGILASANGGLNLANGSGATNYLLFSSTATGNQTVNTNTNLSYNYTNNAITGGVNGGVF